TAITEVPGFDSLCEKLSKSFAINGKAKSTLHNYIRCLAHLGLHYKKSPEKLSKELIDDYLFHCQNLHKTPSESFFKHTIFGLRAIYKVLGMKDRQVKLPQIKRQNKLPVVLSKAEVRTLLKAPKYLKHRLILGMLYGCGLRSYELCALRLCDVDFDRKTVFVKRQKGKVDRYGDTMGDKREQGQGRHPQDHYRPLSAPHLCHAPAGRRAEYYEPERATGTCIYRDNAS